MKIFHKLLGLFLVLSILPLGILGYLAVDNIQTLGTNNVHSVEHVGGEATNQSSTALRNLGEKQIQQKADMAAKQVELLLEENPDMTAQELQNSDRFQEIGVQKVGKTGYTAVTNYNNFKVLAHPQDSIQGTKLTGLKDKLGKFWTIMNRTGNGQDASGYYKWEDSNGEMREKYMYISIVNESTADGANLHVAATTYIDEFTQPIQETRHHISEKTEETKSDVESSVQNMKNTVTFFVAGMVILVALAGFGFAYTLSKPVEKLSNQMMSVAEEVSDGEFEGTQIDVETNDEIGELADSVRKTMASMRYYISKYQGDE